MSDLKSILHQSRAALIVLALVVLVSSATVLAMQSFEQNVHRELGAVQSQETGQISKLKDKESELAFLKSNVAKFEVLRKSGLVGTADREAWAETLLRVHRAKNLPDTLAYTLNAPAPVPAPNPADPTPPAQMHDMAIKLSNIHEAELLDFLNAFREQVMGRFRIQSCQLTARGNDGLNADCVLRFYNQPLPTPAAVPKS